MGCCLPGPAIIVQECTPLFDISIMKEILEPAGYNVQHRCVCPTQLGWPGRRKRLWSVSFRADTWQPKFEMASELFERVFFSKVNCSAEVFLTASCDERASITRAAATSRKLPDTQPGGEEWPLEYSMGPGSVSRLEGYKMLAASQDTPAVELAVANVKQNPDVVRSLSFNVMPTLLRESDLWVIKSKKLGIDFGRTPVLIVPSEHLEIMGQIRPVLTL